MEKSLNCQNNLYSLSRNPADLQPQDHEDGKNVGSNLNRQQLLTLVEIVYLHV